MKCYHCDNTFISFLKQCKQWLPGNTIMELLNLSLIGGTRTASQCLNNSRALMFNSNHRAKSPRMFNLLKLMKLIHIPARCVLYLRARQGRQSLISPSLPSLIYLLFHIVPVSTTAQISSQKLKILLTSRCYILINFMFTINRNC